MSTRIEAGRILLAGAIRYPKIRSDLAVIVSPEYLSSPYRDVYEKVLSTDEPIDLSIFALDLEEEPFKALLDAYENIPTSAGTIVFAKKYNRLSLETEVYREVQSALQHWSPKSGESLAELLGQFATKAELPSAEKFDLKAEIEDLREEVLEAIDNKGITGLSTGLNAIDERVHGLRPGALWVISGRASHGKTQLALSIVHWILEQEESVAYFTLEMGTRELLTRLLAIEGHLGVGALLAGEYASDQQIKSFACTTERAIRIWDGRLSILDDIRSVRRIRQYVYRNHPRVWIVDWLGLLSVPGTNRAQALSEAVYSLKALSRETGTTGIVLHQLNRDIEHRGNWEPRLSDLKDSGGIEEAADVVLSLVRLAYTSNKAAKEAAQLFLLKNRLTGRIADIMLWCEDGRFEQRMMSKQ